MNKRSPTICGANIFYDQKEKKKMENKTNYLDYVRKIAGKTGYSIKSVREVMDAAESVMTELVDEGSEVKVFPSIAVLPETVKARKRYDFKTGSSVVQDEKKVVKARVMPALRNRFVD